MPPPHIFTVGNFPSRYRYKRLDDYATRRLSPFTRADDEVAERRKTGWLASLKALTRNRLAKSDETELTTLLADRKRSGTSLDTVSDYKPPKVGTLTATPQSTPQPSAHGTPPPATPKGQEMGDSRFRSKTSSMMRRARQGAERLRETGKTSSAREIPSFAALRVPTTPDEFGSAVALLFPGAHNAVDRAALSEKLRVLAAPAEGTSSASGNYFRPLLAARTLAAGSGGNASDALRVLQHVAQTVRFDTATFSVSEAMPNPEGAQHSSNVSSFGVRRIFDTPSTRSSNSDLDLPQLFCEGEAPMHGSEFGLAGMVEHGSIEACSRQSSLSVQHGSEAPPSPTLQPMSEAAVMRAAWRTAQLLSHTHHGFEALCCLMLSPPTPELRQTARSFLQAADHLHTSTAFASDPAALLQAHAAGSVTHAKSLAVSVLHAAASKLRGEPASAQAAGALFAWHQGFREDGPGSDLANTKARLAKFVGHSIPRVEKQGVRRRIWQMIGKKKSPLSAAALGVHGAHRAGMVKELDNYTAALRTMIDTLAHTGEVTAPHMVAHPGDLWRHAILARWAALAATNAPLSDYVLTSETLRQMQPEVGAEVGRLQHEMSMPTAVAGIAGSSPAHQEFAQLVTQAGLTENAQGRDWALLRLGDLTLQPVKAAQVHFAQLVSHAGLVGEPPEYLLGLQPSASLLDYWSGYARDTAQAPAFHAALEAARKLERADDVKMEAPTMEDARKTIETLLTSMESGNKVRLLNGGLIGFSTTGISTGLSHLKKKKLPVLLSVQPDVKFGIRRQAVVEITRGAHGRDLFLGTDLSMRGSLGGGGSAGFDVKNKHFGKRLRVTGGLRLAPLDGELGLSRGVVIRAIRQTVQPVLGHNDWEVIKYDDKSTEQMQIAVANLLFEQAAASHGQRLDENALWDTLAQHCGDGGNISVNWIDQTKRHARVAGEFNVGANVRVTNKINPVRLGLAARLRGEQTLQRTAILKEMTGKLRMEQFSVGAGHKVTARAGLTYSVGHTFGTTAASDDNGLDKADEKGELTQTFTGGIPLGYSWKLAEGVHAAKVKTAYYDGKIADRLCYFDSEYSSAREYLAVVRSERDSWIEMLANKPGGTMEKATTEFEAYCEIVEKHARPNQRYLRRYRLRPAAAREIEGHLDLADLYRRLDPDSAVAHAFNAQAQAILQSADAHLPEKLAIVEYVSTNHSVGLTNTILIRSNKQVDGIRELASIRFG